MKDREGMKKEKSNERRPESDEIVDRYLRALSELEAPGSLIPRVQAVIEARAKRPWWQQSYQEWELPTRRRVLSVACFSMFILGWLVTAIVPELGRETFGNLPLLKAMDPIWQLANMTANVVRGYLAQLSPLVLYGLGALGCFGYLLTVGAASFLCRLVQLQNAR